MKTLFKINDIIKHIKKDNKYEIIVMPVDNDLLEESCEPFYKYYDRKKDVKWNRSISQMEDGRFIKIENPFD